MKSLVKPAVLIVLCGFVFFLGTKLLLTQEVKQIKQTPSPKSQVTILRNNTDSLTTQENYVSKVIISAPYAKKSWVYDNEESPLGEFGDEVGEEVKSVSLLNSFTVAPNGDIYIADPLNIRIQRFAPNGSFISSIPLRFLDRPPEEPELCIDQNNNIYISETSGPIFKCDQKGNLLKTYPVFGPGGFVYCDRFGRIFVGWPEFMKEKKEPQFYQVGTSEQAFDSTQQKNSTRIGVLGCNSASLDKNIFFQMDRSLGETGYDNIGHNLHIIHFDGDTLHIFKSLVGKFFGCDEESNIYTETFDGKTYSITVRKYNQKGNLISTFEYNCPQPCYGMFHWGLGYAFLDKQGNINVFCQFCEDGLKVIKWYRQN